LTPFFIIVEIPPVSVESTGKPKAAASQKTIP